MGSIEPDDLHVGLGMNETRSDVVKDLWVEQTARLIRIRDPQIEAADAEILASALWERPLGSCKEEAIVQSLARERASTQQTGRLMRSIWPGRH